ncbi:hypothetical protein BMS3Bbin06_00271 [bacterium BMS3Bbin06]|nr:hypothetical protein BMS3Bbin06_00271 [bacterium BMS3Bbin06]
MVDIGNDVGYADDLSFEGLCKPLLFFGYDLPLSLGVGNNPVPDFIGEIKAPSFPLEDVDHP